MQILLRYLFTALWLVWDVFFTAIGFLGDFGLILLLLLPVIGCAWLLGNIRGRVVKRSKIASNLLALLLVYPTILFSYYSAFLGRTASLLLYTHYREMQLDVLQWVPYYVLSWLGYALGLLLGLSLAGSLALCGRHDHENDNTDAVETALIYLALSIYVVSLLAPSYVEPLVPMTYAQLAGR